MDRLRVVVWRQLMLAPEDQHMIVRSILSSASKVFEVLSEQKRTWYLKHQNKLPIPTISFGNVTWGGTGKTPFLHYVARILEKQDYKPILVSRGYGDDEWKMFQAEFPKSFLAIGKNRYENAMKAIRSSRSNDKLIALIDDGLQQWSLKKDIEIIMIDAYNPFGNNFLIPKGRLREYPETALPRAHLIVLHHAANLPPFQCNQLIHQIQSMAKKDVIIATSKLVLTSLPLAKNFSNSSTSVSTILKVDLKKTAIIGICGIGCPDSFHDLLTHSFPNDSVHMHVYPDHHAYSAMDLRAICIDIDAKRNDFEKVLIVTTKKDYFRSNSLMIKYIPDLRVAECSFELIQGKEEVRNLIQQYL